MQAKELVLARRAEGRTVADAMASVGRSVETWRDWRKNDKSFKAKADRISEALKMGERTRTSVPDFPEFSEKYLRTKLPLHHLRIWDVIEGREPRDMHPAMMWRPGVEGADQMVINVPPDHAKALALDTAVLTTHGWSTIGDLRVGDKVFGPDGKPTAVTAKSEVFRKDCYRVAINDGEDFTASGDHLWTVCAGRYDEETLTTAELAARGGTAKLPLHDALALPEVELELEPYILGYWLGDGHTASGRFTTADEEIVAEFAAAGYAPRPYAKYSYETYGLYRKLARLGLVGHKDVPEGYFLAGYEQRLALLQGLMDSDGTCSVMGQASFTSTQRRLAEGVLTLASSLGLRPSIREGRARLEGRDCGPKWTVFFSPGGVPVFRLPRKLKNQRFLAGPRSGRAHARLRRIVSVERVETVPTQCIVVDNDSHLFLIGRSLVPTHNSTTWSVNYATWLIHRDPTVRIIIISKTQKLAKQFLLSVKQRLTHPMYGQMHAAFGPDGGWRSDDKRDGLAWREDMIYVRGRDPEEKDPTVQALGIGGQVYGSRADVIILDDAEDLGNCGSYQAHATWIAQEVMSRLSPEELEDGTFVPGGRLLVLGTRVGSMDLYRHLRDEGKDIEDEPTWSYFSQPAILDGEHDPNHENWSVLWPERMSGRVLRKKRNNFSNPRHFQLIYQQKDVPDEGTFDPTCVRAAVNGQRFHGPMVAGAPGHHTHGMQGLYVICAWDPASSAGNNAMLVYAVDRRTKKRWVLDVWNKRGAVPRDYFKKLQDWTLLYKAREWRIEKNAVQEAFIHMPQVKDFLASHGVRLVPHLTGRNKTDRSDMGVETLAGLFETCADRVGERWVPKPKGSGLIEFPAIERNPHVQTLINQLILWEPENKRAIQDLVMVLWFAELGARDYLRVGVNAVTHLKSRWASRGALRRRSTVSVEELHEQGLIDVV